VVRKRIKGEDQPLYLATPPGPQGVICVSRALMCVSDNHHGRYRRQGRWTCSEMKDVPHAGQIHRE
jgi:hypothetical protein